jgi:hypothetical protein
MVLLIMDNIMHVKDSPAIIAHVQMMQDIIQRLAGNSAKCKEWCFALIGILIVYYISNDGSITVKSDILYYICGIFCLLDAYYLGLERQMRKNLTSFINEINEGKCSNDQIAKQIYLPYSTTAADCIIEKYFMQLVDTIWGLFSFSIIFPYGLLIVALAILL